MAAASRGRVRMKDFIVGWMREGHSSQQLHLRKLIKSTIQRLPVDVTSAQYQHEATQKSEEGGIEQELASTK